MVDARTNENGRAPAALQIRLSLAHVLHTLKLSAGVAAAEEQSLRVAASVLRLMPNRVDIAS
jgi:hypothetical protein